MTLKSATGSGRARSFGGAGVGDVDEVDDDRGALDVLEELDAEAVAEVSAFDEAGKVGDGEGEFVGEVADLDDAEVGLEGGEGVVGDLGPGGGEARDQGGLADVGIADQAGVGEQAEFEAVGCALRRRGRVRARAGPGGWWWRSAGCRGLRVLRGR